MNDSCAELEPLLSVFSSGLGRLSVKIWQLSNDTES